MRWSTARADRARLRLAREALGGCPTGCAKSTPAFDHAKTRRIMHAVGPVYQIDKAALGSTSATRVRGRTSWRSTTSW